MKKATLSILAFLLIGLSCKKDCPTCLNGGTCVDGKCLCEGLWEGKNCDTQITPGKLLIQGVSVTNFPATDNGTSWDIGSGPDIYVIVKQDGVQILNTSDDWRQNATFIETWNRPFTVTSPYAIIEIELWDFDDFDADDFMGGTIGFIYNDTNGFPNFVEPSCAGCTVSFRIGPINYLL